MRAAAISLLVVVMIGKLAMAAPTIPQFQGVGDFPGGVFHSGAHGISKDGRTVVGFGYPQLGQFGWYWRPDQGLSSIGDLAGGSVQSGAFGANIDGRVIVGYSDSTIGWQPIRWSDTEGLIGLGDLPGGQSDGIAFASNSDGTVVVGYASSAHGTEAFVWTSASGITGLSDLAGGQFTSVARGVSADGSLIVGFGTNSSGNREAALWGPNQSLQGLGDLVGGYFESDAYAISPDGSTIVGFSQEQTGRRAFRWTSQHGMVSLGLLPDGDTFSEARSASMNGRVIVGTCGTHSRGDQAFVWTTAMGMRAVRDLLVEDYGLDLTGWHLTEATGVSSDGSTIVGSGFNPMGYPDAWIATIPGLAPACSADITNDGKTTVADFNVLARHFGEAVTANTNGDLNGDGFVRVADFNIFAGNFGCGFE